MFGFNENNDEVEYDDNYESNEDNDEQPEEKNNFQIKNDNREKDNLVNSTSTNYSLNQSKNSSNIEGINDRDNNITFNSRNSVIENDTYLKIYTDVNKIVSKNEVAESGHTKENEEKLKNNENIKVHNNIIQEQNNYIYNTSNKKILQLIIDNKQNKMTNSIIVSENNLVINYVTNSIINFNLLQNKKVCFLTPDTKNAENIYEIYKANANIKSILLQKGKKKKNKNDLQSFKDQLNQNNLFIMLPNILYKLLSIGFVNFSEFGLIIFDECQLSDSNHPYNIIMQEFYFYYFQFPSNKVNKNNLPNILGITNSPFKEKGIIKNEKKGVEILKNISENLDCQLVIDPGIFEEDNSINEDNIDIIRVKSIFDQKNKIDGINILLMKYFFEPMLDFCLDYYLKKFGDRKELNQFNLKDIKNKYISVIKEKFSKDNFEDYNNVETAERDIHFLPQTSPIFKVFEDIQKMLINIIQNADLIEIYYLFEKYKQLYENNLKKAEESNEDIYLRKLYKKLIKVFLINMKTFKCLINKNVEYKTDRLNQFMNKLNEIYSKNKNSKNLICVSNRKMVYILYNYLNRDLSQNISYKNKIGFIVGTNNKKEENTSLILSIRSSPNEINERKKEYNENKINILICTAPALEYLEKEKCENILVFSDMTNSNNDLEKIKEKAKNCDAKLYMFLEELKFNKINSKNSNKNKKEKNDNNIQIKDYFLDKHKKLKNPRDYRTKNYIDKKNLVKNIYYHIKNTESKVSLKNCMLLFNEIKNFYFSKNIKINVNSNIIEYNSQLKYSCQSEFEWGNNKIKFVSNKYNDKQSAENECYLSYIIYLHKTGEIDDNLKVKM